jgi:hypothetical protein
MHKGKVPAGKGDCPNPIEANLAFGEKLGIQGTPAMILADGKRIPATCLLPSSTSASTRQLQTRLAAPQNKRENGLCQGGWGCAHPLFLFLTRDRAELCRR